MSGRPSTVRPSTVRPTTRRPVVWTSPYIHDQGPINFENAYLDFGFSRIVRTFCASGNRFFRAIFCALFRALSLIKFSVHLE